LRKKTQMNSDTILLVRMGIHEKDFLFSLIESALFLTERNPYA